MSIIDQAVPNLNGGVSQQPPLSRFTNQLESMVNCLSDPVEGLRSRPPSEFKNILIPANEVPVVDPAVLDVVRDSDTRFKVVVDASGTVRVFNANTGAEATVTPSSLPYLASTAPTASIRGLTVADYTYLLNREVTTSQGAAVSPTRPFEALLYVKSGNYGKTYSVTFFDGTLPATVSIETLDGGSASDVDSIKTATIASDLAALLTGHVNGPDTVTVVGSTLYLTHSIDFTLTTSDDQGDEAFLSYKDKVQRFTSLPKDAVEGVQFEIVGDNTSSFDNYHVAYIDDTWQETVAENIPIEFDNTTMPVALVRHPGDTFTLEVLPWVDRAIGDDDSNPFPSFSGFALTDMFYFRDRLGFLADENVILSQNRDYFNFFRTSATILKDGDPIDTPAADNSGESSPVNYLRHAVAFDRSLLIFSDSAQYILSSEGALSPFTAQLDPVTSYASSPDCKPVVAGRFVYFPFDRQAASGIREFHVDNVSQTESANEITAHAPTYLPEGIVQMQGTTLENVLVARTAAFPRRLYIYNYFWNGDSKAQSALHYWEFTEGTEIKHISFFRNVLSITLKRDGAYQVDEISFRPGLKDPGLDYRLLLDRRVNSADLPSAYDSVTNKTTITLPWVPTGDTLVVTAFNEATPAGVSKPVLSVDGYDILVKGDVTSTDFVVGLPYTCTFELTRPYLQADTGAGRMANTLVELRVRDYSLEFVETGSMEATFTPQHREPQVYPYKPIQLGLSVFGVRSLLGGTFKVPTKSSNENWALSVRNSSYFPFKVLSSAWRARIHGNSRRV